MDASDQTNALWKFLESPLTWGGIGVVIGAALVSPAWFKSAFVGGGICVAIGFLRAKAFRKNGSTASSILNLVVLLALGLGWYTIWVFVPKPTEPPTPDQIADQVIRRMGSATNKVPTPAPVTPPSSPPSAGDIANAIVSKLPKTAQNLELSNDDLRGQAKAVAKQLKDAIHTASTQHFQAESLSDPNSRKATLAQIEENYVNNNRLLFAKGNYLRDLLLIRLGRPVPANKLFEEAYVGSTFIVVPEILINLADQLPK